MSRVQSRTSSRQQGIPLCQRPADEKSSRACHDYHDESSDTLCDHELDDAFAHLSERHHANNGLKARLHDIQVHIAAIDVALQQYKDAARGAPSRQHEVLEQRNMMALEARLHALASRCRAFIAPTVVPPPPTPADPSSTAAAAPARRPTPTRGYTPSSPSMSPESGGYAAERERLKRRFGGTATPSTSSSCRRRRFMCQWGVHSFAPPAGLGATSRSQSRRSEGDGDSDSGSESERLSRSTVFGSPILRGVGAHAPYVDNGNYQPFPLDR